MISHTDIRDSIPVLLPCIVLLTPCWIEFFRRLNQATAHNDSLQSSLHAIAKPFRKRWQDEVKSAECSDLWVGLPLTVAISMFISSAIVGLMERAATANDPSFGSPTIPIWIGTNNSAASF